MNILSKLDTTVASEKGAFVHLEHESEGKLYLDAEKTKPMGFKVFGPGSSKYKALQKKLAQSRTERIRVGHRGKIKGLAGANEETHELYASLITEYVNFPEAYNTPDGVVLDLSTCAMENTLALWERFAFMRDCVIEFVDEESNWMGES